MIVAQESNRPLKLTSGPAIQSSGDLAAILSSLEPGDVLFIDEIHRFNKGQQDALLGAVEKGIITLIGATTENPSFEVIPALLSRCQVYILNAFTKDDLEALLKRAIATDEILKTKKIELKETEALLRLSGGDGRKLLNIFELVVNASDADIIEITNERVTHLVQKNTVLYDKTGEQHYDIVSAFIKSTCIPAFFSASNLI